MSDLTPEKLAELRRLAESVVDTVRTPWYRADELQRLGAGIESEDDAAYIAALPPTVVLELLDAAERALKAHTGLRVERSEGWTTVTHPTGGVVLRVRDHDAALAYLSRLA